MMAILSEAEKKAVKATYKEACKKRDDETWGQYHHRRFVLAMEWDHVVQQELNLAYTWEWKSELAMDQFQHLVNTQHYGGEACWYLTQWILCDSDCEDEDCVHTHVPDFHNHTRAEVLKKILYEKIPKFERVNLRGWFMKKVWHRNVEPGSVVPDPLVTENDVSTSGSHP